MNLAPGGARRSCAPRSLAREISAPEQLACAALGLGVRRFGSNDFNRQLMQLLEEALTALGPADSALRASLLTRLCTALFRSVTSSGALGVEPAGEQQIAFLAGERVRQGGSKSGR